MGQSRTQDQDQSVSALVEALQDRIGDGDIEIGSWIRQERIAREYGVSRTPVREALRQLEALGVVDMVANRGARVVLPSVQDITQAFEVRGVLEGHAASLAARNISQRQLDVLYGTEALFREAAELAGVQTEEVLAQARATWYGANRTFHATVIAASGNLQLERSVQALHHRIPRGLTWTALGGDMRLLKDNAEEHRRIREAIEARDEEKARGLVIEHSCRAQELIMMSMREVASP